jgi:succinyl-diaminopimelate desuccinylase
MILVMGLDRDRLLRRVKSGEKDLVELCSRLVKIPSDNPPGDTRQLASYIREYLADRGASVEAYEPLSGAVSLVSAAGDGSPHLILNGHLDQFPGDVGEAWSRPPHSGAVEGGVIHGRGSGDMKGGLASLLFCYGLLLGEELEGRVTFTGTADEETGGRWGALWLLDNVSGLMGDAVLNGEPSGLTARIGEKGRVPLLLRAEGKAAHGSFAGYVGENAVMKMVRALPSVEELQGLPAELDGEATALVEEVMEGYRDQYGHESTAMAEVLRRLTVNVGVIRGGTKENIVPALCEAEVDIRLPLGFTPDQVRAMVEDKVRLADPSIRVEWGRHPSIITGPTYTSPGEPVVGLLRASSEAVTGKAPHLSFTSGGTDCRFWRLRGVPAVSYGPRVYGMGGVDEHITVDDLQATALVHMATIVGFLNSQ